MFHSILENALSNESYVQPSAFKFIIASAAAFEAAYADVFAS
jgi:hypothetical protein